MKPVVILALNYAEAREHARNSGISRFVYPSTVTGIYGAEVGTRYTTAPKLWQRTDASDLVRACQERRLVKI